MEDLNNNNYLGYNTYVSGTASGIINCLGIIVYNKNAIGSHEGVEKISIYNVNKVIESLKKTDKYLLLRRTDNKSLFKYSKSNKKIQGFNTIIYLGSTEDNGVGYTEFINTQGTLCDITIELAFESETNPSINIHINNTLSSIIQTEESGLVSKFKGDELWNYTTVEKIKNLNIIPNSILFTTHISSLRNYRCDSNIWGENNLLTKDGNLYNLELYNIVYDPQDNKFSNYRVGYYEGGDLCLYSWEDNKFYINSLTVANKFGSPINHTSGKKYEIIENFNEGDSILYFAGRFAVVSDLEGNIKMYDTVLKRWIISEGDSQKFIDEYSSKIYEVPNTTNYNNLISIVPDLVNTSYNVREICNNNVASIVGKLGSWYIFSYKSYNQNEIYVLSNPYQYIKIRKDEFYRTFFINDYFLAVMSEDKKYLTIYTTSTDNYWETELARNSIRGQLIDKEVNGITIKFNSGDGDTNKYETAYSEQSIMVIPNTINLYSTWLKNFRRKHYQVEVNDITIKSLVDINSGLVFFKNESGYLSYL